MTSEIKDALPLLSPRRAHHSLLGVGSRSAVTLALVTLLVSRPLPPSARNSRLAAPFTAWLSRGPVLSQKTQLDPPVAGSASGFDPRGVRGPAEETENPRGTTRNVPALLFPVR